MDEKCMKKGCIYDSYYSIKISDKLFKLCNQHMDIVKKLLIEKVDEFINELIKEKLDDFINA